MVIVAIKDGAESPRGRVPGAAEAMGDLAELLDDLPVTWPNGSEGQLLVRLWSALKDAGLIRLDNRTHQVRAVATLLTLHRLKSLFYHQVFGEGTSADDYEFPVAGMMGEYPRVEPFWIGFLAGREGEDECPVGLESGAAGAVKALIDLAESRYRTVVSLLHRTIGTNELFAMLWVSRERGAEYPVPSFRVEQIVAEVFAGQGGVREWFTAQADAGFSPQIFSDESARTAKVLEILRDQDDVYHAPDIPARKLRNIRASAAVPEDETILALVDMTAFGSAKDAVAFTADSLYYRHMNQEPKHHRIKYLDLPAKISQRGFDLQLEELTLTVVGTGASQELLVKTLLELRGKHRGAV